MSTRYSLYLILILNLVTFALLFYISQFKRNTSLSSKLISTDPKSQVISFNSEKSLFKLRLNERLFRLGQQFSHINIDRLLQIQSSSVQTLTYYCRNSCGGWGDRLRGITSTYILAILLQRRFLIDMQYPCDLSNFLIPNLINWTIINDNIKQKNSLHLDPMHNQYKAELYSNISSDNLMKLWSNYDNILLTTNNDYITPVLKNPFFNSIKAQINIRANESTQEQLFPLIFELLFKPTSIVINQLDTLLLKSSSFFNQSIICMHIRIGQNPTVPKDMKIPFREFMLNDMIDFIDRNLSVSASPIFFTSDSYQTQQAIYKHYGDDRILSISGPIIHIDRYNSKKESNITLYHGFLKVISDFYFLGECNTLLKARSGFSEWANHRRINQYSNLYTYCRGLYRVTGPKWRRPHIVC